MSWHAHMDLWNLKIKWWFLHVLQLQDDHRINKGAHIMVMLACMLYTCINYCVCYDILVRFFVETVEK